jgi:hypothetical protein
MNNKIIFEIENRLRDGEKVSHSEVATAVRFALRLITSKYPGKAVEIRVAPFGATQILSGHVHRRGTPSTVINLSSPTFLSLVVGSITCEDVKNKSGSHLSGTKAAIALVALHGSLKQGEI